MLSGPYYAKNYAGVIDSGLALLLLINYRIEGTMPVKTGLVTKIIILYQKHHS